MEEILSWEGIEANWEEDAVFSRIEKLAIA